MTTRTITRTLGAIGALALTGTGLSLGTGVAHAADLKATGVSSQDKTFVVSNAQSNLAEITLGKLGNQRAQSASVKELASVTLRDHLRLQEELKKAASSGGYQLPTQPNTMQRATAAQLKNTPTAAFDLAYSTAELKGHVLAIAAAGSETQLGSDSAVKAYATDYIPVATMHRNMASGDVAALGGQIPRSVAAGTGGLAANDSDSSAPWTFGIAGGLALAAVSGTSIVVRRRRAAALRS